MNHLHLTPPVSPSTSHRTGSRAVTDNPVPPVLPLVSVTVEENDNLSISVDGKNWMSGPIARTALGGVLDAILEDQATPIRVELTEADGRKYVDILSPVQHLARSTSAVSPPTGERAERATTAAAQQLRQVWGHGFVPGEEVAIAVVTHTVTADEEGRASTLVDRRGLPAHQEGILLFGRISGTLLHDELRS